MSIAVFPGSFDPLTSGHCDVARRAATLFDTVVIGVGVNGAKQAFFSIDERIALISEVLQGIPGVSVAAVPGLLVDFCQEIHASAIVKGLRSGADFDIEEQMAVANRQLSGIETLFLPSDPTVSHISSSLVKDIARNGGSIDAFVPPQIAAAMMSRLR